MKPESKFWKLVKKNTPKIQWTRLESWASFGVPDLLGYNDSCGFFMVELKVIHGNKVHFSPHQKLFHLTRIKRNFILVHEPSLKCIKLFKSTALPGLLVDHRETPSLAMNDWEHIQRLLLESCFGRLSACLLAPLLAARGPTHPPCLLSRSLVSLFLLKLLADPLELFVIFWMPPYHFRIILN